MNKNTVISLICIGAILFGFSWYSNKQSAEQSKDKITSEGTASTATLLPDSGARIVSHSDERIDQPSYLGNFLDRAKRIPEKGEEFYMLENEVIKISLGSKGGRVASVELKDYTTYEGKPLMLFERETTGVDGYRTSGSRFDMLLYAPELINTADFYFTPVGISDSRIAFRLYADSTSYLEYVYTLRAEEYMVDFRIDLSHFKGKIAQNQPDITLAWSIVAPKQEKGFENENNFTTIAYRFPGESSIEELGFSKERKNDRIGSKVNWVAFKQQFFSSVLIGPQNFQHNDWNHFASADMAYNTFPQATGNGNIKDFSTSVNLKYDERGIDGYDLSFYFGPNKYSLLGKYDDLEFRRLVPLGWGIFGWVNRWLIIPVFDFLSGHIGNMGLAILLLTLIVKLLIFPLTYKSYLSTAKMRLLKPQIDKINERYPKKEDAMKKQQAVMGLYKSAGVSPMGGCWPMLIQLPILIALFRFFPASIELRGESFLWADDLSAYDSVLNLGFEIPFYGDHISLFTLLMAVSLFITSKINYAQQAATQTQQMPGMKFMMLYMMPAMLLLWFNNYAAGLTYYYFLSNLITMGQTFAFRYVVNDEKLHARMQENGKKTVKKSKWQQRLEDMQKQHQHRQKRK